MKGIGRWVAETRAGRMAFYLGALAVVGLIVYIAATQEIGRQAHRITQRIEVVESADPCVELSQAVKERATKKIRPLTASCVSFLDELGPLISLKLSCAILDEGGYECPKPGSEAARREVVAGSGNTPHGQPSPAPAGEKGKGTPKGTHGGTKKPPKSGEPPSHAESSPLPADTPPAETEPPSPGNSGNGASGEHGLDVCVELVKSACVKVDVAAPNLP